MDNPPGSEFYADIEPAAAERAMARGSIELVSLAEVKLEPARLSRPKAKDEEPAAESDDFLAPEPETEDQ